jgi:hypothetical protein
MIGLKIYNKYRKPNVKGISKNIPLTFSPCNGEIRGRLKKDVFRDNLNFQRNYLGWIFLSARYETPAIIS